MENPADQNYVRVRIRLAMGSRLATKQGHCPRRRAARQMSTWLTQAAAFGYVMTVWKYGYDLGRVREFAFVQGAMSHWQTWGLLSVAAHGVGIPLRKYGESRPSENEYRDNRKPTPRPLRQPLFVVPSSPRPSRRAPATLYRAG
jgi:hypothetical protein